MFSNENIVIPQFTDELKRLIVEDAGAGFDWSDISPTIFGAVFESTLNPETRRSGGMHYTSIENIHKVIDPLFLNDLHEEFDKIQNMGNSNQRINRAREFRQKLGKLAFFDPACGSGNFLTETYLSLRKMENECLRIIVGENLTLATSNEYNPLVKIQNFYGIEINDFAVAVARTAMWIAESQMWEQTKDITYANQDFLPLDSNDSIYEGNALRMDWKTIVEPYKLDYIMGNPPFVGYSLQSDDQKADIKSIYVDKNGKPLKYAGKIDYVAGWFHKASQFIQDTNIQVAFVSTNSITQGEQVQYVWQSLYDQFKIKINFAYRTFRWDNEASQKAHVHVVIVGFGLNDRPNKALFDENGQLQMVSQINPYLVPLSNVFIASRSRPINDVSEMVYGSKPTDGGNLLLSVDEYHDLIAKEPNAETVLRPFLGAKEYINNQKRYCIWTPGVNPSDLRKLPLVMERIQAVHDFRLDSKKKTTRESADRAMEFQEIRQPEAEYIIVPRVSSERRKYVPMGYEDSRVIARDSLLVIPNATLYEFGVLTSNVHMAWMRAVAGRLKSDYRYSAKIVYNNFPWPDPAPEQKEKITQTAQAILDARELYLDASLADLYDDTLMPNKLRQAHQANDRAVMKAYGLKSTINEAEIVQQLFKMYEKLTKQEKVMSV